MDAQPLDDPFLTTIPAFSVFEGVSDAGNYHPLPDGWALATADIVGSTQAIAGGRYKSVNMAGAAVISAVLNALGTRDLPFVFGGDGAVVAFPQTGSERVREALAATQRWAEEELDLDLRAAIVPIEAIRAEGLDVRVGLFQASDHVGYAMFAGGGASWAEAQMKAGRYGIEAAPAGARPDLTGLSCRWSPIKARRGEIVSVIATPAPGVEMAVFQKLVAELVALVGAQEREGHPIPAEGPDLGFTAAGIAQEAKAAAPRGKRLLPSLSIFGQILLSWLLVSLGIKLGSFDARAYRAEVGVNSDFRKFDDGLKMTIDIDAPTLNRLEAVLKEAEKKGICRYGLHRQDSALMTCFVVTPLHHDHVHFIDGAAGGYAMAASQLKARAA